VEDINLKLSEVKQIPSRENSERKALDIITELLKIN
jgi:hypothetical protein